MINDGTAGGRTHSASGRSWSALFHRFGLALAVSVAIAAFALATHGEALTLFGVASRALLFAGPLTVIYSILGRVLSHRLAHAFGDLGWTSWLWSAAAAIVGAGVYGVGSAAHALQSHGMNAEIFSHGIVDGAAALTLLLPILCLGAVIRTTWVSEVSRPVPPRPCSRRLTRAAVPVVVTVLAGLAGGALNMRVAAKVVATTSGSAACDARSAARVYDVVATNVTIPHNRWGSRNPHGMVYALRGDVSAIRSWYKPVDPTATPTANRRVRPRPLVLRANEGECVRINFVNELSVEQAQGIPSSPRASMHIFGAAYDAATSDGGHVGFNADTSIPLGGNITYYWRAPAQEGLYLFRDMATPAGSEHDGGSSAQGLYGALAVEPAGSTWVDPESNTALYTGTARSGDLYIDAVIVPPTGNRFRESVMLSQDELPEQAGFAFNYGAEPEELRDRFLCPDCSGEETSLSSWAYGDPALVKLASGLGPWLPPAPNAVGAAPVSQEGCGLPSCWTANVTHAYVGDPTKIRFGHAGVYETHVFHLHAHQWLGDPKDVGANGSNPTSPTAANPPQSNTLDSQTYGPWEAFTADLLFGAGSKPGTVGDSIFHCHLYPHFAAGFWALLRVHDVVEDGSRPTPDGILVRPLAPLPERAAPPLPTADNPGYPRFIPGAAGWRAPQPPLAITNGPEGADEPRVVAGKVLAGSQLAVEQAVQTRLLAGRPARRGAPFRDPCAAGAREVTFNVSAIQLDIVYNSSGWHDTQGRILVPDADVASIRAGNKKPEPLYFRANQGDCINFRLTNLLPSWLGNDAFLDLVNTSMIGQHIHLVKFDVMASDGASNGWNYQQAAFTGGLRSFNQRVVAGQEPCSVQAGCRMPRPASWDPNNPPNDEVGQTIHGRWYADYELRTVFTHDHHFAAVAQNRGVFGALVVEPAGFDFRNPFTGAYKQPINQAAHGTVCTPSCLGTSYGTSLDIIGPGAADDFREFGIAIQDYTSLTKPGGNAALASDVIEPPGQPEIIPQEDPGVMAINYRNEPIVQRLQVNGVPSDPANWFSSFVHGDPATPIFLAYGGDRVRIRLVQGAQEEQHNFEVHGTRWKSEPGDPESTVVAGQSIGISEAFNLQIPSLLEGCQNDGRLCQADFLYGGANLEDRYLGAWGLIRAFGGRIAPLLPLPDNQPEKSLTGVGTSNAGAPKVNPSGNLAKGPLVRVCPAGAPVREFSVVAMEMPLKYSTRGLNDPYGLMYALAEDEASLRSGTKVPEPLVLRANEGDCIRVSLQNHLTAAFLKHAGIADGDAPLATEPSSGTPTGLRVSLHPQIVQADVRSSDGANVGFNLEQTAAPGETVKYEWYADDLPVGEIGMTNLTDFGDIRGHRHHGLFAALVIEPVGAKFHDPYTGAPVNGGLAADIRMPNGGSFRENVVFYQDGLTLRNANGRHITDPVLGLDVEDRGEVAIGYRSEPFFDRIGHRTWGDPVPANSTNQLAHVMSSTVHGDPSTPIMRAYVGDPMRLRIGSGGDRGRMHTMQVGGHSWAENPLDPGSRRVGLRGGITTGSTVNIHIPSTSPSGARGDYQYGDVFGNETLSGGSWGILRVYNKPSALTAGTPTTIGAVDTPYSTAHPLMPLSAAGS